MADFSITIKKLEFEKVLDRIQRLTVSEPGRELARSVHPMTDVAAIEIEHRRVSEAKSLLIADGSVPLDGIRNILPAIKKASIENHILTARELVEIASTLAASRQLASFLARRHTVCPLLAELGAQLYTDRVVEFNINECIDAEGVIRDTASKELRNIRAEIIATGEQLRKRLAAILKRVSEKEFLQEEIITTRDGRMVIPVKVEHKNHVPGFIHSSSASGATVFIEPAETLDLNNALTELQLSEQREIARILAELTRQVASIRLELERSISLLAVLDLEFAKAKYSIEVLGNPPRIASSSTLRLVNARHPVLLQRHGRDEVVPLTFLLDEGTRTVIITGPNAGGKSVAMKTIGLLCLCSQAGLHIPAAAESELGVFQRIFADIGDDQSIEQDLSTFSSHVLQLREILREADESSLVLIDEIGAGTDPAEGGALAASILQELTARGVLTIATTHHGMLKAFAHQTPGVANASMEFDARSLLPTYRFRMGLPGSSYALELARRLELPQNIVDAARSYLGEQKARLEELLTDLEQKSQEYRTQIRSVSAERDRLSDLVRMYDEKMKELRKELQSIRRKAVDEAEDIVKGAQSLIERTIKEIRETAASKAVIRSARESVRKLSEEISELKPAGQQPAPAEFRVGDRVKLRNTATVGDLVALKGENAVVVTRNARLHVKTAELEPVAHTASTTEPHQTVLYQPEGKTELDLRGHSGDEAVMMVQRFLDDALVAGLHRIDIIHGKGTGALRRRIAEFLKTYPHIKTFRLGEWNEGGSGVTVVELAE